VHVVDTQPKAKWYHWTGLGLCSATMLALGLLEVLQGADPSSRLFAVDNVVVHVFGVGLIVCALLLPLRRQYAFTASIWMAALTLAENLITYRFEAVSATDALATIASIVIILGGLLLLLIDLRVVFRDDREAPPWSSG
jgi:hypothetical protein